MKTYILYNSSMESDNDEDRTLCREEMTEEEAKARNLNLRHDGSSCRWILEVEAKNAVI